MRAAVPRRWAVVVLLLAATAHADAGSIYRDEQGRFCFLYPEDWVPKHRRFQHLVAKVSSNRPGAADCYLTLEPAVGRCRLPDLATRYRSRFHQVEVLSEGPASLGGTPARRVEVRFLPLATARERVRQRAVAACRDGSLYTLVCGVLEREAAAAKAAFGLVERSFRFGTGCSVSP